MNLELNFQVSCGGVFINESVSVEADGLIPAEPVLPVAWPLTSWVKTDANTAAGNLAALHGQTTGTYDVYWTGGRRYGVDVTITVNACALDGGSGDDFPASANLTVTISKQTQINCAIDGDALGLLALNLRYDDKTISPQGHATFKDAAADVIAEIDLDGNIPQFFHIAAGQTNPFTGDPITTIYASQANTSNTAKLQIAGAVDVTP